jgi:hypothetical protein
MTEKNVGCDDCESWEEFEKWYDRKKAQYIKEGKWKDNPDYFGPYYIDS